MTAQLIEHIELNHQVSKRFFHCYHNDVEKEKKEMSYECLQWSKSKLKRHVKVHHYEQSIEWKTCHEHFGREENFLHHRKTTHEVSKFCCGDCGKNFNRKDNLKRYTLAVHKKSEEFRCNLCDSKFNLKYNLKDTRRLLTLWMRRDAKTRMWRLQYYVLHWKTVEKTC